MWNNDSNPATTKLIDPSKNVTYLAPKIVGIREESGACADRCGSAKSNDASLVVLLLCP